jgi:hypothetical protein
MVAPGVVGQLLQHPSFALPRVSVADHDEAPVRVDPDRVALVRSLSRRLDRTAGERPGLIPGLFATNFGFMRVLDRFLFYGERLGAQPNRLRFNALSRDFGCYTAGASMLWKLGCTNASGASARTTIAASASVRNVTARRSTMTAISTTAVM